MATAVEHYFNTLIDLNEATCAVITDAAGGTVVECFGTANADESLFASNVVISAQRVVTMMDQLRLGVPNYVSAQYKDQVVVQHVEARCVVTLIGSAARGHTIGSLTSVMTKVTKAAAIVTCLEFVRRAEVN